MKQIVAHALGNHRDGYRGQLVAQRTGQEVVIAQCDHRHPTTREAYECMRPSR